MRRREFIRVIGGTALGWPFASRAQPPPRRRLIGFLGLTSASTHAPYLDAFHRGLGELGYIEGRTIEIAYRWADGKYDRLPRLAKELVGQGVEVLVTHATPGSRAAKEATTTVPVVMIGASDPVAAGLVTSVALPSGNLTGLTFFFPEICAKRVELIAEIAPDIRRIAVLLNPANPTFRMALDAMEKTAQARNVILERVEAQTVDELSAAIASTAKLHREALVVIEEPLFNANVALITTVATRSRLPVVGFGEFARAGALMGYGVYLPDLWVRAAGYVDKLLRGELPANLPIEGATKFELVINLKTAKALGLTVPPSLLARADEVIE